MEAEFAPEYWVTYEMRSCYVRYYPATRFTDTIYPDGTHVPASPEDSAYYRDMAQRLGYGADVAACCREHEILHTFLAEAQGLPYSPLLWAIAHQQEEDIPLWQRESEEAVIIEFQRYLNGADPQTIQMPSVLFEVRGQALRLLRLEAFPQADSGV